MQDSPAQLLPAGRGRLRKSNKEPPQAKDTQLDELMMEQVSADLIIPLLLTAYKVHPCADLCLDRKRLHTLFPNAFKVSTGNLRKF